MGMLHHRRFLLSSDCEKPPCSSLCCDPPHPYVPPTPPLVESPDDYLTQTPSSTKHIKISTSLIISFSVIATASIIALCCYAIYVKFFSTRNRRRPQTEQDLLEEDHQNDPAVDHPIWYIRTVGLHQAVIGAISVCKYRKDEGLIEGTECSVCLSEFQEDQSLRLLPKCNHAFHLPCIDTWLTSHTNCPMCRAPIVTDPTRIPSIDPSTSFVEEVMENSGGDDDYMVRNEEDDRVEEENENSASQVLTMQPRRSVSLDSSSASKITLALETLQSRESLSHSKRVLGNLKRSRSFNAKHLLSWYSRSQTKPNPPLRSF